LFELSLLVKVNLLMASFDQVVEVLGGLLAAAFGLYAIVIRRVEVGEDHEVWYSGWRAVVIGFVCLLAAYGSFYAAANNIPII